MSLRKSLQTFNHTIWAAKNSARLVKGTVNTVRKASRGLRDIRRRLVNGPKSNVVAQVRKKTRGSIDPKYFAKNTPAGVARRMKLAQQIRAKRNTTVKPDTKLTRTRSEYPGKVKLERGMTGHQLKRRVTAFKRREHVKDILKLHQGNRKDTANFIRNMRSQGLKPKFKANAYDPLYKKAVKNYTKAFGSK